MGIAALLVISSISFVYAQSCTTDCIFEYDDFSGGLNTRLSTLSLPKREGDIVEMIGSTLKGEKAKVLRIDKQKEEVVVSLLGAVVPLPVTVKIDNIKVVRREEEEEK